MIIEKYVITSKDHYNVQSLIVYTPVFKCNLNCLNCYNKQDKKKYRIISPEEFEELTEKAKLLGCELCIISGGEPLMNDLNILFQYIDKSSLPVRIDTNGTFVNELKEILKHDKVYGIALDIKIPLYPFYFSYLFPYEEILGIRSFEDVRFYEEKVRESLTYLLQLIEEGKKESKWSLTRTVMYKGKFYYEVVKQSLNRFYNETKLPRIKHYFLEFIDDNYKFKKGHNIFSIIDENNVEVFL